MWAGISLFKVSRLHVVKVLSVYFCNANLSASVAGCHLLKGGFACLFAFVPCSTNCLDVRAKSHLHWHTAFALVFVSQAELFKHNIWHFLLQNWPFSFFALMFNALACNRIKKSASYLSLTRVLVLAVWWPWKAHIKKLGGGVVSFLISKRFISQLWAQNLLHINSLSRLNKANQVGCEHSGVFTWNKRGCTDN